MMRKKMIVGNLFIVGKEKKAMKAKEMTAQQLHELLFTIFTEDYLRLREAMQREYGKKSSQSKTKGKEVK